MNTHNPIMAALLAEENVSEEFKRKLASKFCKDCKWASRPTWLHYLVSGYTFAKCSSPSVTPKRITFDPVTGVPSDEDARWYCSTVRGMGECGPQGSLWEPRS